MPFVAVTTRRLYQEIADQVAQLIRAGEYKPGDCLPSERDLGKRLQVSRPVVREAMVALEIAGLVEVRGGSGIYVRDQAVPAQMPDVGIGPYEAFMARRVLEGEIAAEAALHADEAALAELDAALDLLRQDNLVLPPVGQGDRRFHMALAAATGNSVYAQLIRYLWDELLERGPLWAKLGARRSVRPTRIAEHEDVVRAVRARDPDAARRAMHVHIDGAIADFLEMTAAETADEKPTAAGKAAS
ncbi:MAG TPA: FadR/GntR family transcriptional regulator [Devosiaceae bacterium]|jgi:DNA-binding FadR family transcriptional regulator